MDLQRVNNLGSSPSQTTAGSGKLRFTLPSNKILLPVAIGAVAIPFALIAAQGPSFTFQIFRPKQQSQYASPALRINNEASYLKALKAYVREGSHTDAVMIAQTKKTFVCTFPTIDDRVLFKVQKDLNLFDKRHAETEHARAVIKELSLTKLYIPRQRLITIDGKHILLEERCDLELRDITGENPEDLDLVRQFAIFCCATGYWDIKQENNPFLKGKNIIAFVDLEFIRPPKPNHELDITELCRKAKFNPRQASVAEQAFLDCGHKTILDRKSLYGGSQ